MTYLSARLGGLCGRLWGPGMSLARGCAEIIRVLEGLVEPGTNLVFTLAMLSNQWGESNLVDSASSHTLVSKIKPCMSKYNYFTLKTANGSLYQL